MIGLIENRKNKMVDLNNKKILVTGGSGFIGRNFVEYVLQKYQNLQVVNLDKMGAGSMNYSPICNLGNSYTHQCHDIRMLTVNHLSYLKLPDIKYDYVFHFAAESHVDRSINDPLSFISNNVIGMGALMEYCRTHQSQARIINISTDEVYGHLEYSDPPFTELSTISPRSPYSASKASADLIAKAYHETYGMDIITTRCCNNYGPYQHGEKFIPTILRSLNNGDKIPVYGNGFNIREWIYVEDHNKSVLEIAEIGISGEVYNIGSGIERDNIQLITNIIDVIYGRGDKFLDYVTFVEDRKGHDFRYAIKSLKYSREFDITPYMDGLRKTIKYYIPN
jgi:dTDP-glucose 4,6-dehydratase